MKYMKILLISLSLIVLIGCNEYKRDYHTGTISNIIIAGTTLYGDTKVVIQFSDGQVISSFTQDDNILLWKVGDTVTLYYLTKDNFKIKLTSFPAFLNYEENK